MLFIENKLLYLEAVQTADSLTEFDLHESPGPAYTLRVRGAPAPTLTLAAYGYMAELARQAMLRLAYEHEVFAELVVLTQLAPFDVQPVLESAGRSGRLLAVEEGGLTLGWGAEVLARLAETPRFGLRTARRLAAADLPVPASGPLEEAVLPGVEQIIAAARQITKEE